MEPFRGSVPNIIGGFGGLHYIRTVVLEKLVASGGLDRLATGLRQGRGFDFGRSFGARAAFQCQYRDQKRAADNESKDDDSLLRDLLFLRHDGI